MKQFDRYAIWFLRIVLSIIFISAAIFKILQPENISNVLQVSLGINITISRMVVIFGSILELTIGVGIVLTKQLSIISLFSAIILLIVFTFVGIVINDPSMSCGCFGNIYDEKFDLKFLLKNIVLLGLSLLVLNKVYANAEK